MNMVSEQPTTRAVALLESLEHTEMSEIRPFVDALSGDGYSFLLVDAKDANALEVIVPKCCYLLLHFSIQIACSSGSGGDLMDKICQIAADSENDCVVSPDPKLLTRPITRSSIDEAFPIAIDEAAASTPPLLTYAFSFNGSSISAASLELHSARLPDSELQDQDSTVFETRYLWSPCALCVPIDVMASELEDYLRYDASFEAAIEFISSALKGLLATSSVIKSQHTLAHLMNATYGNGSQSKINELFNLKLKTWPKDQAPQRPCVLTSLARLAIQLVLLPDDPFVRMNIGKFFQLWFDKKPEQVRTAISLPPSALPREPRSISYSLKRHSNEYKYIVNYAGIVNKSWALFMSAAQDAPSLLNHLLDTACGATSSSASTPTT